MAVRLYEKKTGLEVDPNYIVDSTEELRKLERDFVVITKEKEGKAK